MSGKLIVSPHEPFLLALDPEVDSTLTIDIDPSVTPSRTIVEKKGLGHPDTLTDHLAEALSQAYSRWTLTNIGAVLHHNFDKVTTHGGGVEVEYGGGRVTEPVKIMVNGRVTRRVGQTVVPVEDIVETTISDFFHRRLPTFAEHLEIKYNLSKNSSPGSVRESNAKSERDNWFDIESIDDLRERAVVVSNDTSMGTGFAPLSTFEEFVKVLVEELSGDSEFRRVNLWCGTDVKMMLVGDSSRFDAVLAVPQVSKYVQDRKAYVDNLETVRAYAVRRCEQLLGKQVASNSTFRINARDLIEKNEIYLTLSGSSLESGDEGVVGRGNRANGLITPLRTMNLEGINGKNPVYHIGKLYNIASELLADRLATLFACSVEVSMVSATGQRLDRPWKVLVRLAVSVDPAVVEAEVRKTIDDFPALTRRILAGELVMA